MRVNPKFKKIAVFAAKEAGKIIEKNFRKINKIYFKSDLTPVTDVDLKADKIISTIIKKNFPSHDILSEETGGKIGKKYTWVIDPLDGTTNYIAGISFFAVSLALIKNREPILGV
jgi:myo-inositol-1(or 4)-monophosphatase